MAVEVEKKVAAEEEKRKSITTIKSAGTLADANLKKRYTQIWPLKARRAATRNVELRSSKLNSNVNRYQGYAWIRFLKVDSSSIF
jgi:hypothetical protein